MSQYITNSNKMGKNMQLMRPTTCCVIFCGTSVCNMINYNDVVAKLYFFEQSLGLQKSQMVELEG